MNENVTYSIRTVPRDESGRLELLATLPPLWEYLLFGNALFRLRAIHEARWRDFKLGYTLKVGPVVERKQLSTTMSERLSYASAITSNLERILDPPAQEQAFGRPGEPGNVALIEHMATRLIDLYSLLLEWAEETRALRVPDEAKRLRELLARFASQPLQCTHDFVDEYIASLERAISRLAAGEGHQEISMQLTFEIEDDLLKEYKKEFRRVMRKL